MNASHWLRQNLRTTNSNKLFSFHDNHYLESYFTDLLGMFLVFYVL